MSADPRRRTPHPGADPDLRASGLRLAYDNRLVVDDLDLAVPPGRITAIVGANACGKSTLLRALARLLAPRGGRRPPRRPGAALHTDPGARPAARHPAADARRPRGTDRHRPGQPRAAHRTRPGGGSGRRADEQAVHRGAGRHRHDRPRRPARRRAVRRAAAARLDRHGGRPGHARCCCSTSRRRTWTWPTRSTSWTWSPTSTGARAAPS